MTHRTIPFDFVRSEEMEFFYPTATPDETIGRLAMEYHVGIEVVKDSMFGPGAGVAVRVVGHRDKVLHCLEIQWDNGGDCMKCFALMSIKEPGYEAKWNAGQCEHKSAVDNLKTTGDLLALHRQLNPDPWKQSSATPGSDPKFHQDYPRL